MLNLFSNTCVRVFKHVEFMFNHLYTCFPAIEYYLSYLLYIRLTAACNSNIVLCNCYIVLLCNCNIVLSCNCSKVLLCNCNTVLLRNCNIVILFSSYFKHFYANFRTSLHNYCKHRYVGLFAI